MAVRIEEFMQSYGFVIVGWFVMISVLGLPAFSLASCFFQTLLLLGWTYFGHVVAHYVSQNEYIHYINPHIFIHHNNELGVPRWLNLLQETVTNMSCFLILLWLQNLAGVELFSTSIVVSVALLYVIIHIADYSILGNAGHKLHHEKGMCNYAPDFMDVLFDTRCEPPEEPYVNTNHQLLHGAIAVGITAGLKWQFQWS
jgi:hypothetical protein